MADLPDAPHDELKALCLKIMVDRKQGAMIRGRVTGILQRKSYAGKDTWDVLESVVLDKKETDSVVQRLSLNALGRTCPIDRLVSLLQNRAVYSHRYFAIRIDVATALAALNVRDQITFEILCRYLVDEDKADTRFQVRSEAYLSVFALTGTSYGVAPKELFARTPRPIKDAQRARDYLWRSSILRAFRPSHEMVNAIAQVATNLGDMKKIRQTYESHKEKFFDAWATSKKAEEDKAAADAADKEKKDD